MRILLEEKILEKHSKKNSKYYWVLETIIGKNEVTDEFDEGFEMIGSETGFIQNIKEEIIEKINSENVFSFEYEPKEGDYLSIKNNLRKKEYLNLIFLNNLWVEEIYACTYRDCESDIYTTIKTGVAFLSDNEIYF